MELSESDGGGFDYLELLQAVETEAADVCFFDQFSLAHDGEHGGRVAATEFAILDREFSFHF